MFIDHIGIAVSNYDVSKAFYAKVLAPLGMELIVEVQGWAGFGRNKKADFWFGPDETIQSPIPNAYCICC